MLESLNASVNYYSRIVNGPAALETFTTLPRSNAAFGILNDTMLVFGGQAGGGSPYPLFGYSLNMTTKITTQVSGYHGTFAAGTNIKGKLYISQGHDGERRSTIYNRPYPSGAPVSPVITSGKQGRTAAVFDAINSNTAYWGLGYVDSGWGVDLWRFNADDNSFTALAPIIDMYMGVADGHSGVVGNNGELHILAYDQNYARLRIYDPVTNSWRVSRSFSPYNDFLANGGSGIAYGKHVFYFSGHRTKTLLLNQGNYLRCLRYNTEDGTIDLLEFKNVPGLYGASLGLSTDKTKMYVVSGELPSNGGQAADNRPRSDLVYVFNTTALASA